MRLLPLALLASHVLAQQQAPAWQTKSSSGKLRLVGTSFGVAGRNATFDYVVVGGGTAGLTIASRLAEHFSVAVIEAGSFYEIDNGNISQVPGSTFQYEIGASFLTDWNFKTEPEPGYGNRTLTYARGRCLGGSSALNDQGYQRPTVETFDEWANQVGDNSWTWDNVLPFYKKSVNFTEPQLDKFDPEVPVTFSESAYSHRGGPLKVSYGHYQQPLTSPVVRGLERIGLREVRGQSSGELIGWGFPGITNDPDFATRSSSETSFLQQAFEKRPTSIQVYQQALAKRIVFDSDKRATGVEVTVRGSIDFKFTLSARKEIILSSGALQSPQLLMVSGVGPEKVLKQHGIDVVADRPGVGQNLQDQPWFLSTYRVNVITASELDNNATYAKKALEQYLTEQSGPLSNIGADVLAWDKFPHKSRKNLGNATLNLLDSYPEDWPDIEYVALADPTAQVPNDGAQYMTFSIATMKFSSRGFVSIKSNDTSDPPVIQFNYLTTKEDQEIAVQGFRRLREWADATGATLGEIAPGPDIETDDQILQYLRQTGNVFYHASATCAMGRPSDPQAVVDSHTRVYGVKGLRVVDAGAFPFLPPGHPQATVYMLAEKIASEIIGEVADEEATQEEGKFEAVDQIRLRPHMDM